jgi:hypothetical protein
MKSPASGDVRFVLRLSLEECNAYAANGPHSAAASRRLPHAARKTAKAAQMEKWLFANREARAVGRPRRGEGRRPTDPAGAMPTR